MGKKMTKKKSTKAERMRMKRRRQMIRNGIVFGGIAAVCVVCLIMISIFNRPVVPQSTWYVEDGAREIAAPPMDAGGARLAAGTFETADNAATDGSSNFDAVPDLPTRAEEASDEQASGEVPSFESEFGVAPDFGEETADTREILSDDGTVIREGGQSAADANLSEPEDGAAKAQANPDGSTSITITAAGDCTFGGCLKHDTYKVFKKYVDAYGYDYFFQNVRSLFQQDDLTIINLEGPLTDVGTMTTKSGICFRGEPEWTAIMTGSSVEVCNFANNHAMDMGKEGFERTTQALDEAGIGYCAYSKAYNTTVKGVRVTVLGFDKWNNSKSEVVDAVKKARPDCDLLIVNMHWGFEMHYEPMKDQKDVGHAVIDAGADLVIGTHPHVYGGVEQYKGKYICYSLGNFCFGGNTMPSDQRAMMFQQVFNVSGTGEITDGGINVIPVRVSGDSHKNDFQPRVLGAKAGAKLLKAIAKYSNLNKNTVWMTASYPEQIGLLSRTVVGSADSAASAQTVTEAASDYAVTGIEEPEAAPLAEAAPLTEATKQPIGTVEMTQEQKIQIQEQIYYDQMVK
ncbi:MAG: CapA family protein [Clostridia bacterium]|nr:CapA family protein [Clostridia bacterium]